MPKVTIWIRVEDEAKWKAIKNKPEWLHEHLSKQSRPVYPFSDPHPGELHSLPTKEVITDIKVSDPKIHDAILEAFDKPTGYDEAKHPKFDEPTLTPPEETL